MTNSPDALATALEALDALKAARASAKRDGVKLWKAVEVALLTAKAKSVPSRPGEEQ